MLRLRASFSAGLLVLSLLALLYVSAPPGPLLAQGSTVRFFDDFEQGVGGWNLDVGDTGASYWHLVSNPQEIAVHSSINPDLVSLPDSGHLPGAYSGTNVMWFGEENTGTFIGSDFLSVDQEDDNGGESSDSHSGCLGSPGIDLSDVDNAYVEFRTWWEIEGKDTPTYDLMEVQLVWLEGNAILGSINPVNDVDGEPFRPYSSGGLGQIGQWKTVRVDLSSYTQRELHVVFCFDSVDERYNGFRGWLIDDVRVVATGLVAPQIESVEPAFAQAGSFITLRGRHFVNGATVTVGSQAAQTMAVISTEELQVQIPTLDTGKHEIVVRNPDGKTATAEVTVTENPAPMISDIDPNSGSDEEVTRVTITGSNFQLGAKGHVGTVELVNAVVSPTGIRASREDFNSSRTQTDRPTTLLSTLTGDVPSGLAGGYQNVSVTNPDGQRDVLQGGFLVKAVINPPTLTVDGQTISPGADGIASIRTGQGRSIAISVPTNCGVDSEGNPKKVKSVTVTHGGVATALTGSPTGGVWSGSIPALGGPIYAKVVCESDGGTTSSSTKKIGDVVLIDPSGFIYDDSTGSEEMAQRVEDATVVLYHKHPDLGDIVWDAKKYDQISPQKTNVEGRYGWDVPAGDYFIRITHPCYLDKQSQVVTVPPPVLDLDVGITPNGTCPPLADARTSTFLPFIRVRGGATQLVNGGFESGATGWSQHSSQGYSLIVNGFEPNSLTPRTGEWGVWLGGAFDEIAYIDQVVSIGPDRSTLSYWQVISSADECGHDQAGVLVDGTLVDAYSLCGPSATDTWQEHRVDLSAYIGDTVRVEIRVETNEILNSNLFLDDVSFVSGNTSDVQTNATNSEKNVETHLKLK